jgi:GNAT superfamily N-acetyltransferase
MSIALAKTDSEIRDCFPVMVQLRPRLVEAEWVPQVRRMEKDGFELVALREDGVVRAVAGFRVYENLYAGRLLYVDDLVTDQNARSRGHGQELLLWLKERARANQCASLELDSGTHRVDAHRFYLRERMIIANFHFVMKLEPSPRP